MKLITELVSKVASLWVTTILLPGFRVADLATLVVTAIVLGAVNMFIRPILQFLALPITIVTLGIFAFVINAALLYFSSIFIPGFEIDSFQTAFFASLIMAILGAFFNKIAKNETKE